MLGGWFIGWFCVCFAEFNFFSAPTNFLIIGSLAFNFGMIVELVLLPARFAL